MAIAGELSVEVDEIYDILDSKISPLEKKIQDCKFQ